MGSDLYIVNQEGDVFAYYDHSDSSSDVEPQRTSFLFTSYPGAGNPVSAMAIASGVVVEDPEDTSDESESSPSTGEDNLTFYVARSVAGSSKAIISCHGPSGEILNTFHIPIQEAILGLEVWPGDGTTLVATSENNFYIIDISEDPAVTVYSQSPVPLTHGLAYKSGSGQEADFYVGVKAEYPKGKVFRVAKDTGASTFMSEYTSRLPNGLAGFATWKSALHGAYNNDDLVCKDSSTEIVKHIGASNTIEATVPIFAADIASAAVSYGVLPDPIETTVRVSTKEYDYESGELLGEVSSVALGSVRPNGTSDIRVFRMEVFGVDRIGNVRLGIVDADLQGGNPADFFLIGQTESFDPDKVPDTPFPGLNDTGSPDDANNYDVGTAEDGVATSRRMTYFVYLMAKTSRKFLGVGHARFKWFFEFDGGEIKSDDAI